MGSNAVAGGLIAAAGFRNVPAGAGGQFFGRTLAVSSQPSSDTADRRRPSSSSFRAPSRF